mgnify:CR=1 FL=1
MSANIWEVFLKALFVLCLATMMNVSIITHSDMSFKTAIEGSKAPQEVLDSMVLLNVEYYNFENQLCKGQIVVNKVLQQDVEDAFKLIKKIKFPIEKVIPIVKYNWSDDASMEDNNTSAFNYRFVANTTRLSNHSWGRAIDFNPFQNPAIYKGGSISPKNAKYNTNTRGTLGGDHEIVKFFKSRGWNWGGDWKSLKDYQHFDKN